MSITVYLIGGTNHGRYLPIDKMVGEIHMPNNDMYVCPSCVPSGESYPPMIERYRRLRGHIFIIDTITNDMIEDIIAVFG